MSRATIILKSQQDRLRVANMAANAPAGTRVEMKAPKRTLPQNDRLWAMLSEIARKLPWHGVKLTPEDWKLIFMDALKREVRIVPNIDGTGFVNIGARSSDLSVAEFADLLEIVSSFAVNHGVTFPWEPPGWEPEKREAGRAA